MRRHSALLALILCTAACGSDNASTTKTPLDQGQEKPDAATQDMVTPPAKDMSQSTDAAARDMRPPGQDMRSNSSEDMATSLLDMKPSLDMRQDEDMRAFPPVSSDPLSAGMRPATVVLPKGFDNSKEVPLVIALHGYTGNGRNNALYLRMTQNVDAKQFVLLTPDGTRDMNNAQFWNATDACCGFGSAVDDEGYLRGLIKEATERFRIDRGRIYLVGHSNGGFMSYRMACRAADLVTGIFSFAGATYNTPTDCAPSQPVHIIQMHGTADTTIAYGGGRAGNISVLPEHPGAPKTATLWAGYNECDADLKKVPTADVSQATAYPMTLQVATGCKAGGSVELWTMEGGVHNPMLPDTLGPLVLERLFAHDRTP